MNKIFSAIAGFAALAASSVWADDATVEVVIDPGTLALSNVTGQTTTQGGAIEVTGSTQTASVTLSGIGVSDLDGNGLGWDLAATPPATITDGSTTLNVGTGYTGFNNASDSTHLNTTDANNVDWTDGAGVDGWTIDYTVTYDVPAFPTAGTYTGTLTITVTTK